MIKNSFLYKLHGKPVGKFGILCMGFPYFYLIIRYMLIEILYKIYKNTSKSYSTLPYILLA
jgi:hypothetical protein